MPVRLDTRDDIIRRIDAMFDAYARRRPIMVLYVNYLVRVGLAALDTLGDDERKELLMSVSLQPHGSPETDEQADDDAATDEAA